MASLSYQAVEPLTDSNDKHVEAARQRIMLTVLTQAYAQLKTVGTYTLVFAETITLPAGKKAGSIMRTLSVTS